MARHRHDDLVTRAKRQVIPCLHGEDPTPFLAHRRDQEQAVAHQRVAVRSAGDEDDLLRSSMKAGADDCSNCARTDDDVACQALAPRAAALRSRSPFPNRRAISSRRAPLTTLPPDARGKESSTTRCFGRFAWRRRAARDAP